MNRESENPQAQVFRNAGGQIRARSGRAAGLALLALCLFGCRPAGPKLAPAPFHVAPETTAAGAFEKPRQTVVADLDGDASPETLRLYEQSSGATDAEGVPIQHVQVTVTARRGRSTLVDEDWAVAGTVSVLVSDAAKPPYIGVGVPAAGELNWYQWNGSAYRATSGTETGSE